MKPEGLSPNPEQLDTPEKLASEVKQLAENVDSLKNALSILSKSGFEAFKTIFKKK